MAKQITKKLELDLDQVDELFLNKYDYWGSIGGFLKLLMGILI
jgi:hypothetical protein